MKKKILILPLMTFMFMLVFVASLVCANSFAVYAEDEYTQVYVVGEPQIDEDEVGVTITITGDDDMLYVYFVKTLEYAKTYTISNFNGKYTRRCSSDRTTINEGPSDATLLIEENGNVEATMITSSGKYKISSKPANIFSSLEDLVTKLPATDTSVNVTVQSLML